jgi:meromycolic acid enoyl-[acyl-carrier-protein] reductase
MERGPASNGAAASRGRGLREPSPALTGAPLLEGKRLVITGVITKSSIAWTVARMAQLAGAEVILTGFGRARRLTERAARALPRPAQVLELDVSRPDDFERLTEALGERFGSVDGALHAVAFAPPEGFGGNFVRAPVEVAEATFRISAYSLKALAEALLPLMRDNPRGGSIVALDFDATKVWPQYDWMGPAKAALESIARYLAFYLGPSGVRVNLVGSGPLETLAATSLPFYWGFSDIWHRRAPLGWDTRAPDVVAEPICFLFSDLARAITGELLHVDGGYNAIATEAGVPEELSERIVD